MKAQQEEIENQGIRIGLVHMSSEEEGKTFFKKYGLEKLDSFSSPDKALYKEFSIKRASLNKIVGPQVWLRGASALLSGHLVGKIAGDTFQMPGMFLLEKGKIIKSFFHKNVGDRPDYLEFVSNFETVSTQNDE